MTQRTLFPPPTLFGTSEEAREHHEEWKRTVRDPATSATEGPQVVALGRSRTWRAEYELALLPDGRWAVRYSLDAASGGVGSPWSAYEDRVSALAAFIRAAARAFLGHTCRLRTEADVRNGERLLSLIVDRLGEREGETENGPGTKSFEGKT